MYCPQCGSTNEESAAFCAACGFNLTKHKEQWYEQPAAGGGTLSEPSPEGTPAPVQAPGPDAESTVQPAPGPSDAPPPYRPQYQQGYQAPPVYRQAPPYPQQGYYPPAGHQPGYSPGGVPHIPSYLGWAITTLILCFWPTGIVAVVFATKVGNLLSIGDVRGAQEASHKAKLWCWITFAIGVAVWVLVIVVIVLAVLWSAATYINNTTF